MTESYRRGPPPPPVLEISGVLPPSVPGRTGARDSSLARGNVVAFPPSLHHELDSAGSVVEVQVLWGEDEVLRVEHVRRGRAWVVGDSRDAAFGRPRVDFIVGEGALGTPALPLLLEAEGGRPIILVPPGASGGITTSHQRWSFDTLRRRGDLCPSPAWPVAEQLSLPPVAVARVVLGEFTFLIREVSAGRRVIGTWGDAVGRVVGLAGYLAAVSALAALLLAIMYLQPPEAYGLSGSSVGTENRFVSYLLEPEELRPKEPDGKVTRTAPAGGEGAPDGARSTASTETGGDPNHADARRPRVRRSRRAAATEVAPGHVRTMGILGVFASTDGFSESVSPFGAGAARGDDPAGFFLPLGALTIGGLGMPQGSRGTGDRTRQAIGAGPLRTSGPGTEHDAALSSRLQAKAPPCTLSEGADCTAVETDGQRLPREAIRRVVHRHLNEVRFCYSQQLNTRPDLAGRVTVAFIVTPSGAVQSSTVASSTLDNQSVEQCIALAVRRWTFPQPEGGGVVAVHYPFVLQPSD